MSFTPSDCFDILPFPQKEKMEERKPVKNIVLFEGHVRWIMERETPEERLAAWEVVAAIAFPHEYELPYEPPEIPADGSPLSPCDKVRRDTYHMMADFILSRVWEQSGQIKNQRKVEAGKIGASAKYGYYGSPASTDSYIETEEPPAREPTVGCTPAQTDSTANQQPPTASDISTSITPKDAAMEELEPNYWLPKKMNKKLNEKDRKLIDNWHKKIPNAAALREFLERGYMFQNKSLVTSPVFCDYAYARIARECNFVSPKTGHAYGSLFNVIHWLALDYIRKENEIRRASEEEKRKDIESEFETKVAEVSQMTNEEIMAMERKRQRKAEREAMAKVLRGEL